MNLLGILTYAISFTISSNKILEVSFDIKNKFKIPLDNMSDEDRKLLELLFWAIRYGADFVTDKNTEIKNYRDKTLKITEYNNKKIVETSTGIKFYIDSIHPGNTIVECFVSKIHLINSNELWKDKIVIDVGAECGDTPLYYASKGATVYAFEPIKENYDSMLRNIALNTHISGKIIPINAAIGKDQTLRFYQDPESPTVGASFVYNKGGKNALMVEAQGYTIQTVFKKFNIKHVDLLKMDCKGCEFFLTDDDLKNVDSVKIEYTTTGTSHKLDDLKNLLERGGFEYMIYRTDPITRISNRVFGHIYGKKTNAIT